MKLHNLLLTAALFISTGVVFATQPAAETIPDFQNIPRESSVSSINVTVFFLNDDWDYALVGYNDTSKIQETELLKSSETEIAAGDYTKVEGTLIAKKPAVKKLISEQLTDLPKKVADAMVEHAENVYQFSVPIKEDASTIGLRGGEGIGNTAYSSDEATNNNMFWAIGDTVADGQIVFFGKSNFLKNYNNGAMILVGGKELAPVGSPLPAPVVTLLIALGFGTALVMYRNRKQAKV